MKKIAIDCRFGSTNSGIGRYTRELVSNMLKENDTEELVLFVSNTDEEWLRNLDGAPQKVLAPIPHYSIAEQIKLPRLIKNSGASLYFAPHFNVPFICPLPYVITIHDLILHWYPNQAHFLKRKAYKVLMQRAVKKADRIIAVSEFTKKELIYMYGKKVGKKTNVIQEGVSDVFEPKSEEEKSRVRQKFDLQKPFFLYVGNAKEHKNVQTLIDAFLNLSDTDQELVLVSDGPEVERLRLGERVKVISGVTDADLPSLYSSAKVFVTASRYEGFCLPVAEAQACGCPVIASNKAAIPEIACSQTKLVEPNKTALTEAMSNLPEAAHDLKGLSWEKAARETFSVLRSLF